MHDRLGEEEQLRGRSGDGRWANGAWARAIMWSGERTGGDLGVYGSEGPAFDYDIDALQLGMDLLRQESDGGVRDHVGVYGVLGRADATVQHVGGRAAGRARIDAWSLGGYWTHFLPNGAYLDGVAQYTSYDASARSPRLATLEGDATGWALSAEGGWPFHLRNDWLIEPQLQLTYQTFDGGKANDVAAQVTFVDTDSMISRVGVRLAKTWRETDAPVRPLQTTAWLRVNWMHEFMDDPQTTFSSEDGPVSFKADIGHDWLELNSGLSKQLSNAATLYGGLGYQWNLDRSDAHAWSGKFGIRFNW